MPAREFTPEPALSCGEPSLGQQRSSMRPSSARYSFGRGAPRGDNSVCRESPGPAVYSTAQAQAIAAAAPAAFFGTAPQIQSYRPYPYPNIDDCSPVKVDCVLPSSKRAVFGREERGAEVTDPDLVRRCPETKYGKDGPGFVYNPDYRSTCSGSSRSGRPRPLSAPSYSMRGRAASSQQERAQPSAAPNSYESEAALGVQRDSRRKTGRASSFGRAERFAPPREAEGQLTAECLSSRSSLGGYQVGRYRERRPPSATFGSSTREASSKSSLCRGAGDQPPAARLGPPRLPHPTVAAHKELLRYSSMA